MIHVLYRHTSNYSGLGKHRPEWFTYEKCLESMLSSIEGLDFVKFHLLYDGSPQFTDSRIDYIESFKGGSDWASYVYTWNYAKQLELKEEDLVFFAENDYIFLKGWAEAVQNLFQTYVGIDYVTLYDHPHFYNQEAYPGLMTMIFPTSDHHWKTVPSSTGSVICGKRIINEDWDVHTSNPSDKGRFEYLGDLRKRCILAPIPTFSTHCEVEWLAPVINWNEI